MDESDPIETLALPTKAAGALRGLKVFTVKQFLNLDLAEVLELQGYGRGTQAILAKQQANLARRLLHAAQEGSSDDVPLAFNSLMDSLSLRAQQALGRLGITSIDAFLKVREFDVLALRSIGLTTWKEIAAAMVEAWRAKANRRAHTGVLSDDVFMHSPPSPDTIWALPFFHDGSKRSAKPKAFHEAYGADTPLQRLNLPGRVRNAAAEKRIKTLGALLATRSEALRAIGVGACGIDKARELVAEILLSGQASPLGRQPFSQQSLLSMPLYANRPSLGLNQALLHPSFCPTTAIQELELSVRASHALERLKISTIGDLLGVLPDDLCRLSNCGTTSVSDIQEQLRVFLLEHNRLLPRKQLDLGSFGKMVQSLSKALIRDRRTRLVLARRLGINNGPVPTLEDLASTLDISKERVRQIEATARRRLSTPSSLRFLAPFRDTITHLLSEAGCIIAVTDLAIQLAQHFGWRRVPPASGLIGMLEAIPEVVIIEDDDHVRTTSFRCADCEELAGKLDDALSVTGGEMHLLDLAHRLRDACASGCPLNAVPSEFKPTAAKHLLSLVNNVVVEDDRVLTKKKWRILYGIGLHDLTVHSLESLGTPSHYAAVAECARQLARDARTISDSSVRNCLRQNGAFILVGRGTYALASWGHDRYLTHAEAVLSLMQTTGRPLRTSEILRTLCADGRYREANLRAVLSHNRHITKVGDDLYDLAERNHRDAVAQTAKDIRLAFPDDDFGVPATSIEGPEATRHPQPAALSSEQQRAVGLTDDPLYRLVAIIQDRRDTAYAPVLLLAILDAMQPSLACPLDAVIRKFLSFYAARRQQRMMLETSDSIIAGVLELPESQRIFHTRSLVLDTVLPLFLVPGLFSLAEESICPSLRLREHFQNSILLAQLRTTVGMTIVEYFSSVMETSS
jgi:hypothetical protein